jgi:hypothetical protein
MHHPVITRPPYDVQPERVFLLEVNIRTSGFAISDDEIEGREIEEGEIGVLLTLGRPTERTLVVCITLEFENSRWYEGTTTYGAEFRMAEHVPPEAMESTWRYVASELAPITLYPFLREVLLNVTGRTLAPKLVLPFAPLPLEMGNLEIPTTDAEQRVMQFEASGTFRRGRPRNSRQRGEATAPTQSKKSAGASRSSTSKSGVPRERAAGTTKRPKDR